MVARTASYAPPNRFGQRNGRQHRPVGTNQSNYDDASMCSHELRTFDIGFRIQAALEGRPIGVLLHETKHVLNDMIEDGAPSPIIEEVHSIQAQYEEPIAEFTGKIQIQTARSSASTKYEAAKQFVREWCTVTGCRLQEQPWLFLTEKDAFFNEFVSIHDPVELASIAFGNLGNYGIFYERYGFLGRHGNNKTEVGPTVTASFAHDRKEIIFRLLDPSSLKIVGRQRNHDDDPVYDIDTLQAYRLTLRYDNICRMIVDAGRDPEDGGDGTMSLFLQLRCPPVIQVVRPDNYMKKNHKNSDFRWDPFMAKSKAGALTLSLMGVDCQELVACPYLKIAFPLSYVYPRGINGNMMQTMPRFRVDDEFFEIVGRMRQRMKAAVSFASILTNQAPKYSMEISPTFLKNFPCDYALAALLSRGYAVWDQINPKFLDRLKILSFDTEHLETALNCLTAAVDERRFVNLVKALNHFYQIARETLPGESNGIENELKGSVKVRKVVVTPTRTLYLPPEVMMSNRVVRDKDLGFKEESKTNDYALRLVVRRDDNSLPHLNSGNTDSWSKLNDINIFKILIRRHMEKGILIAGRLFEFLAWSNSQLRDRGCYMFAAVPDCQGKIRTASDIRKFLGRFDTIRSVPKLMARMGQCFTQSRVAGDYSISSQQVVIEEDVKGSEEDVDPATGEPYVFSDGVGKMPPEVAKQAAIIVGVWKEDSQEGYIPSAAQIRYGGCKGLLVLDPNTKNIVLRKSMVKFETEHSTKLEIVKWSQPSPLTLNRPEIMILDQVSEHQGQDLHRTVKRKVLQLLEDQLFRMADMLLDEERSMHELSDRTSLPIDWEMMHKSGFRFTEEPLFRGLLLAMHRRSVQFLFKQNIEIPFDKGRVMYGCMDETHTLNYGQVFVQYSLIKGEPHRETKILTGRVMVTKNPAISPGDVRVFEAIDVPGLRHLIDVIVFPSHGKRPHPDEMAGSDLDGDEYAVCWIEELMFDHNEEAESFPKSKAKEFHGDEIKVKDMVDCFIDYSTQDSIGYISSQHLKFADAIHVKDRSGDQHDGGLFSNVCRELAQRHAMAVDFPKTGVPPEPIPNDFPRLWKIPDFMDRFKGQIYSSPSLCGQIYRIVKRVEDTLALSQIEKLIGIDKTLIWEGFEEFIDVAKKMRDQYNHHIQHLMDSYGIEDEFQLISGHFINLRVRFAENEKEDFSFYNTERVLELQIGKLWDKFRGQFFKHLNYEQWEDKNQLKDEISTLSSRPDRHNWLRFASACYLVTYDYRKQENRRRYLSFPWIFADVLSALKYAPFVASLNKKQTFEVPNSNPIIENLQKAINKVYTEAIRNGIWDENHRWNETHRCPPPASSSEKCLRCQVLEHEVPVIEQYCQRYPDLEKIFFVISQWARKRNFFESQNPKIKPVNLALLFLHYAVTLRDPAEGSSLESPNQVSRSLPERKSLPFFGEILMSFLKYMASGRFRYSAEFSFEESLGINRFLGRTQHRKALHDLHVAAMQTYQHVALTGHYSALNLSELDENWDVAESDPVQIRWNYNYCRIHPDSDRYRGNSLNDQKLNAIRSMLKEWSGCREINMRKTSGGEMEALITGRGSVEARQRLRRIVLNDHFWEWIEDKKLPEDEVDF